MLDIKVCYAMHLYPVPWMEIYMKASAFFARSRRVVNNETRIQWCLPHPNFLNVGENIDMLAAQPSRHLHPIPVLELLAAYGGDFWHSNALLCAVLGGVGYSMEEQCIKVLAWSLQMGGQELILINRNIISGR